MTAVLKRTNSVGHKKKEKQSADPKKNCQCKKIIIAWAFMVMPEL